MRDSRIPVMPFSPERTVTPGVSVLSGGSGITGILESLMNSLEGED